MGIFLYHTLPIYSEYSSRYRVLGTHCHPYHHIMQCVHPYSIRIGVQSQILALYILMVYYRSNGTTDSL
jgi:hypothetical protein